MLAERFFLKESNILTRLSTRCIMIKGFYYKCTQTLYIELIKLIPISKEINGYNKS